MTYQDSHKERSGGNFYTRVEGKLDVIEADIKSLLEMQGRLDERVKALEKNEKSLGDKLWEVTKYVILAVVGGLIGAWIKTAKP